MQCYTDSNKIYKKLNSNTADKNADMQINCYKYSVIIVPAASEFDIFYFSKHLVTSRQSLLQLTYTSAQLLGCIFF